MKGKAVFTGPTLSIGGKFKKKKKHLAFTEGDLRLQKLHSNSLQAGKL
jgi:hypothetical protein